MRIYLAGKVRKNCWRHKLVYGLRGAGEFFEGMPSQWPILPEALPGGHDYTGPYFVACDHGCYHGERSHGVGAAPSFMNLIPGNGCGSAGQWDELGVQNSVRRQKVVQLCTDAINGSDCVFAWIDQRDAFGTFTEIGYAVGRGIPVYLAFSADIDVSEFWFLQQLANGGCVAPDAKTAFRRFRAAL